MSIQNKQVLCRKCGETDKFYYCGHCDYATKRQFDLKRHVERKHSPPEDHPTTKRKFYGEQYTQDDQPSIKRKCGENMIDVDELRKMLIERTYEYNRKVALGEQVYKILGEGEVKQGALPKDMQEALELYEKENNDFNL